jgi:hypothetical protein
MGKWRKKPVVIEAIQYHPAEINKLRDFLGYLRFATFQNTIVENPIFCPVIETLEGDMKVNVGDWVIKGVNGEFYPCKPDIFEKTYERVEDGQ